MRVFNLTENDMDYRGRTISANGGWQDYPELDTHIPTRDIKLAGKVLGFGIIPRWWQDEQRKKLAKVPPPPPRRVAISVVDSLPVAEEVRVEERPFQQRKKFR